MNLNSLYFEWVQKRKDLGYHRGTAKGGFASNFIDVSHNDYLCLSKNKEILDAAFLNAELYGLGSRSSRLLMNDSRNIYIELEKKIAEWKGFESAIFFATGYQLNSTILPAILDQKVIKSRAIVFGDKANHSSINNGILSSGSRYIRYKNTDMDHLSFLLKAHLESDSPKFVVTESIFGMDGTVIDVERIVKLCKEHKAFLYIDEAHATGLFGKNGSGLVSDFATDIDCVMGTFSKAMGCQGGYIACSNVLHEYLINSCHGFIYSTAPSPILVGACSKAIDIVSGMENERVYIQDVSRYIRERFAEIGVDVDRNKSHIVTIVIGDPKKCAQIAEKLKQKGILVSCVRYPTVPKGTDRLRIAINLSIDKKIADLIVAETYDLLKNE